jgi:hypothetical protein
VIAPAPLASSKFRSRFAIGTLAAVALLAGLVAEGAVAAGAPKQTTPKAARKSTKSVAASTKTKRKSPTTTLTTSPGHQHGDHPGAGAAPAGAAPAGAASLISTEVITADMAVAAPSVVRRGGRFAVVCPLSHRAANDPVIYPGQPGASHLHNFFGNRTTNADSTGVSLVGKSSTCRNPGETAAYWSPSVSDSVGVVEPFEMVAYYSNGTVSPSSIESFPTGLEMLAGNPAATAPQDVIVAGWSCDPTTILEPTTRQSTPPTCPAGRDLTAAVTFPQCWDGRNLRSLPGQAHVARPRSGDCPSTHPRAIPELTMTIRYRQPQGQVTLASGSPITLHADVITAWVPGVLDARIASCIRAALNCE